MRNRGGSAAFLLFLLGLGLCLVMLIFIMVGLRGTEELWDFLRMLMRMIRFWE